MTEEQKQVQPLPPLTDQSAEPVSETLQEPGAAPVLPESVSLPAALEGLLFVHNRPLPVSRLADLLGQPPEVVEKLIHERKKAYDEEQDRGLQIVINEEGVQMATKACISQIIQRLEGQKLVSLSLPALETLSVIAYKQPITRAELEGIRGVNCDGVISTLLDKKLIYVSGEKPVIGRPRLYSTTQDFLYYFGIKSLKELPMLPSDLPDPTELMKAPPEKPPTEPTFEPHPEQPPKEEGTEGTPL